jgi:integrase
MKYNKGEKRQARFALDQKLTTRKGASASESVTFIMMTVSCADGQRLKMTTGVKAFVNDWDEEKQLTTVQKTNERLVTLSGRVNDYFNENKVVRKDELKAYLLEKDGKTTKGKTGTFFTAVDQIIVDAKNGDLLIPRTQTIYEPGTLKSWDRTRVKLFAFNPEMTFEDITIDTYQEFIKWATGKNFTKSYIGSTIKDWKTFMEHAKTMGLHSNMIYRDKAFKALTEKVEKVYLDSDEVDLLIKVKLTGARDIIRDRFIVNLFTGLRISDLKKLKDSHVQNGVIVMINKKTGNKVAIPVAAAIKDIIIKYDGKLPQQFHEAYVNREIKKIAELAGINQPYRYKVTKGGRVVHQEFPKHELITNHTARRSMVTNMLRKGISTIQAQKVVGMSLSTLERYNKITHEENAKDIAGNAFFQ